MISNEAQTASEPKYMSIFYGIQDIMRAKQGLESLLGEITGTGQEKLEKELKPPMPSLSSLLENGGNDLKNIAEQIDSLRVDIRRELFG